MKILTICNYGQVRSVTVANILRTNDHQAFAAGMLNTPPWFLDKFMSESDLCIICNKPNVEEKFCNDIPENYAEMILGVLEKHKNKTITCDTIGYDRWGKPNHPKLLPICVEYVEKLKKDKVI